MPKFRVRYLSIIDREVEAFDLDSATRQARFIAGNLRFFDSGGEIHNASLYSIEEIKDKTHGKPPPDPFTPRPQRQFAA